MIFLSEAFTRPKVMKSLAKAGFTQSYTYFTWRNFKAELEEYFTELTQSEMEEYYRGNLFPNTHDILPFILQEGGRPAFKMRFALAATLSSVYGIYSGYELCENTPRPGPGGVPQLREVRVQGLGLGPAGQHHRQHHAASTPSAASTRPCTSTTICASTAATTRTSLPTARPRPTTRTSSWCALNLDPFETHHGGVFLPPGEFGIRDDEVYEVEDLLTGATYSWYGRHNWVRLDPEGAAGAHLAGASPGTADSRQPSSA